MIIDARLVPEGHSTFKYFSDLESVRDTLPPFEKKIECLLEIDRNVDKMYVHIWFSGEFNLECSRCLNHYRRPISGEFRIIISKNQTKSGRVFDNDEVDYFFSDRNDQIDISDSIYDEINVELPLMPLCSVNCEGIDVAGRDVVIEYSDRKRSENKQIDPRWHVLTKLKINE